MPTDKFGVRDGDIEIIRRGNSPEKDCKTKKGNRQDTLDSLGEEGDAETGRSIQEESADPRKNK